MRSLRICVWQESPSMHQTALLKALKTKCELIWILQHLELAKERKRMGWSKDNLEPDMRLTSENISDVISNLGNEYIHVFGGTRSSKLMRKAYKQLLNKNVQVYVQTEATDYFGFIGKIRIIRGYIENILEYRKLSGVFAIGSLGMKYYHIIGFPKRKTFPFGYFMEKKNNLISIQESSKFQILYVGRLTRTKGVIKLIKAVEGLSENFLLKIIGNGDEEKSLKKYVKNQDALKQKVEFSDFIENETAVNFMKISDLVVLPSISKDGWGAVVSEALMQGTPAIATDKCGSSILLQDNYRGEVVKAGSVQSLKKAILSRIRKGMITKEQRGTILEWSKCLSGEIAAEYMIQCITGEKPKNPWT